MNQKSVFNMLLWAVVLTGLLVIPAFAADGELPSKPPIVTGEKPVADVIYSAGGITFSPKVNYKALIVTVSGPDGTVVSKRFDSGGTPYFGFSDFPDLACIDGLYNFELRVTPHGMEAERANRNNLVQSGNFRVANGSIINGVGPIDGRSRLNDREFNDDVIIRGDLCVGVDCTKDMLFGSDNVIIKDTLLRVLFQDTSTSSDPSGDFRIIINDDNTGSADYFSLEDVVNSRRLFTLEAGAPVHSLYVDDNGRVGLGTSVPSTMLHIVDGNTPTIKLDQDTSGSLTAQAWEISGNHSNFYINDVTNGNKKPFIIETNAPSNSFYIGDNGNIGIGTSTPTSYYSLEVQRTGSGALIVANRTDGATVELSATSNYGYTGTRSDHPLRLRVNNYSILQLNSSGNYLQVYNSMGVALGNYDGTWNDSSSRELKEKINPLSAEDATKALEGLEPVTYYYKANKEEERVGFIAEDVPELVASKNRKVLSSMDLVAVLTKVTQEQDKKIIRLEKELAELKKKIK